MNWYFEVLKKYAVFSGRARRKEYWFFILFNIIISVVISFIAGLTELFFLSAIYALAVLIPSIAVGVRRLHDTNRSGWWILINFIPIIGTIIFILFAVSDSQEEENQYGLNPKIDISDPSETIA
jgi:uncharacterized membrane protein YhaH (DUF805 family)